LRQGYSIPVLSTKSLTSSETTPGGNPTSTPCRRAAELPRRPDDSPAPGSLAWLIVANLACGPEKQQRILELDDPMARIRAAQMRLAR
jgi:hypothetical protein